jgi:hypothetical protein
MPLSKKTLGTLLLFGFIIFLLGGGFDVIKSFTGGQADAQLMDNPKATGLSPVIMVLYCFGFLGVMFIYWSGTNFKVNEQLATKQFVVGLVLFTIVYVLSILLFRVGMS